MKMYRPHRLYPRNSKPKEPSLYRSLCVSILCMFLSTVMLVGTTFAWFHSSATSAVSTITAGGLNVSTSYITKNTALAHRTESSDKDSAGNPTYSYADIGSLGWIPFSGNGGNPFGSISVTPETPQIVFLKVENKSPSYAIYRLSLNLLGDVSADQSGNNLFFGYQVLKPTDDSPISTQSLCSFSIPSEEDGIKPNDSNEADATVTGADSSTSEKVTTAGIFYGDALSVHGISSTDSNTYGGNLCVVDLPKDSIKYIAVALYMRAPSSETVPPTSSFLVQLSMTVNQLGATDPLMPNVVGSTAVTQQELDAAFSLMYERFPNEDELLVVGETKSPEDNTVTNTETPAKPGDATDQPTPDTNATETPTPLEPSTDSTDKTETKTETVEPTLAGGAETHVSEPPVEVPTT